MELRFENLLAEPEIELTRICRFLGAEFDPSMLEIDRDTSYGRPNSSESKSWRKSATDREVRQVEVRVGHEMMKQAGYAPSGLPISTMNAPAKALVTLEEAFHRVRRKIQIYGFSVWLAAMVGRRLGLTALRDSAQRRIDAIDNERMK